MTSEGPPRRFVYKRWVEGPLEGMDELSQNLADEKEKMNAILGISALVLFAFFMVLAVTLVLDLWKFIDPLINASAAFPPNMAYEISGTMLGVIFIALTLMAGLLAIQVLSFMAIAFKRFENVDELFGAADPGSARDVEELRTKHHLARGFNLFAAQNTFTRGIANNTHQASRQMLTIRIIFFLIPLYFWARMLLLPLLFDVDIALFSGILETIYEFSILILSILSIIAGVMIVESDRFMQVFHARLSFLEKIKDSSRPVYSADDSQARRLIRFLGDSDKCYGEAVPAAKDYLVQHASDDCLVLARSTVSPPSPEYVERFLEESRVFVEGQSFVPPKGRFIILFSPEGGDDEISEEVERFILANPIELGDGPGGANSLTVIQIIVEEGGAYSLFPFVE